MPDLLCSDPKEYWIPWSYRPSTKGDWTGSLISSIFANSLLSIQIEIADKGAMAFTDHPTSLDQDVYEIELLLDFVSGRPDQHMTKLNGSFKDGETILSAQEIVKRFYLYRGETLEDPNKVDPERASFIITLKDTLNTLVSPARGLTIGYTAMFSVKYHPFPPNRSGRLMVAQRAFPGLIDNANNFRLIKIILSWSCIIVTVVGAVLLWQAFYGEQLASRFEIAKAQDSEAANHLFDALDADKNQPSTRNLDELCQLDPSKKSSTVDNLSTQLHLLCNDYAFKHAELCAAVHDVGSYGGSNVFKLAKFFLPAHDFGQSACASLPKEPLAGQQEDAPTLLNLLTVASNYLLPIVFGLSGSLTAFLRGLQEKVRDSILAPRDSALTFIRIPLGIIAGITVGLFFNGNTSSNLSNVSLGTFSLTSAGIAFMAGYAAEAFFAFLDKMIDKAFSLKD